MGASMLHLMPGDVWHSGWWCGKDVGLVFGEEMVNHLLYVICVAMVNGLPCLLYDVVHFNRVCGVSPAWLPSSLWSLYGLQGLGELLLSTSVDVFACLLALQSVGIGLLSFLGDMLVDLS